MDNLKKYTKEAVELLEQLIAQPSISRDESLAAQVLEEQMAAWGLTPQRIGNNILVYDTINEEKPTLLLNAHIDTVKPVKTWTRDPFKPTLEDDQLYGLGSNDCGGGLVATLQTYRIMLQKPRNYNILWLATAEEEVSGENGDRKSVV